MVITELSSTFTSPLGYQATAIFSVPNLNVVVPEPAFHQFGPNAHDFESRGNVPETNVLPSQHASRMMHDPWNGDINGLRNGLIGTLSTASAVPRASHTSDSNQAGHAVDTMESYSAAHPTAPSGLAHPILTSAALALNNECLPPVDFPYQIAQTLDSAYESAGCRADGVNEGPGASHRAPDTSMEMSPDNIYPSHTHVGADFGNDHLQNNNSLFDIIGHWADGEWPIGDGADMLSELTSTHETSYERMS